MKNLLRRPIIYTILLIIIAGALFTMIRERNKVPTWTTDTVSTGTVRNITSVSGVVDAISSAELAFPSGGIIERINAKEGDTVKKGTVLATLRHTDLSAEYQDAKATLRIAEANRDELKNGARPEELAISKTTAEIAMEDLTRITTEQNTRVTNAYQKLLSSEISIKPKKNDNEDTPPTISGTYTCKEGVYTIETFPSAANSGYSYRLSGLEQGTYTAYTESAAPLGKCGLYIQFATEVHYGNSLWIIEIPNKQSALYVTNLNEYNLAVTQQTNAIREAEQKFALAKQNSILYTAAPRTEALSREEAKVQQAQARLSVINAQITDHVLTAPFDGTITSIEPVTGETVTTAPIITMVSNNAFALTALIPEIDVTKISIGQKADVVFDARQNETLTASIIFISPLAKEVDGVSYFEAKLVLDTDVTWLRSGLNADIDIILDKHENVTRISKRYLQGTEGTYTILVPNGKVAQPKPITVLFMGNDGFAEVSGLNVGDTIIAP
jgi:multidrug efflux pump subunit AcrA (membrane-fusion protein)